MQTEEIIRRVAALIRRDGLAPTARRIGSTRQTTATVAAGAAREGTVLLFGQRLEALEAQEAARG
jgi:hypothetical protein